MSKTTTCFKCGTKHVGLCATDFFGTPLHGATTISFQTPVEGFNLVSCGGGATPMQMPRLDGVRRQLFPPEMSDDDSASEESETDEVKMTPRTIASEAHSYALPRPKREQYVNTKSGWIKVPRNATEVISAAERRALYDEPVYPGSNGRTKYFKDGKLSWTGAAEDIVVFHDVHYNAITTQGMVDDLQRKFLAYKNAGERAYVVDDGEGGEIYNIAASGPDQDEIVGFTKMGEPMYKMEEDAVHYGERDAYESHEKGFPVFLHNGSWVSYCRERGNLLCRPQWCETTQRIKRYNLLKDVDYDC